MTDGIELSVEDDVATLTINRPDKGNALRIEDLSAMGQHLSDLGESPVRALVLTGEGDRAFSAGMDLTSVADPSKWEDNPLTRFEAATHQAVQARSNRTNSWNRRG